MITSLPTRLIFSIIGSSADGLAYGIDAACQWHSCATEVVSNWANHSKVVSHHWNIPLKDKRNTFHPNSYVVPDWKGPCPPKKKQCGEGPEVVPDPWNIPLKDQPNMARPLQKPLTPRLGRPRCHVQHLLRRQLGLGQRHHHHQVLRGAVGRRQGGAASVLPRKAKAPNKHIGPKKRGKKRPKNDPPKKQRPQGFPMS